MPLCGEGKQNLIPINIEDEARRSYLDYDMSVIIGRALPDIRDGLKPVHRRILFGPIMMTMLVATLGLLPAAMSHGIGSDSQRPFAIVIVGGLISDLVMSIFLLPTLYVWMAGTHDVLPQQEAEFDEQA
jgi:hypothetical protein